jgi:hypothetical protein
MGVVVVLGMGMGSVSAGGLGFALACACGANIYKVEMVIWDPFHLVSETADACASLCQALMSLTLHTDLATLPCSIA